MKKLFEILAPHKPTLTTLAVTFAVSPFLSFILQHIWSSILPPINNKQRQLTLSGCCSIKHDIPSIICDIVSIGIVGVTAHLQAKRYFGK